jgi:hypothetical protein
MLFEGGAQSEERPMTATSSLSDRLGWYWKVERACAVLFPPLAFVVSTPTDVPSALILALSLTACCSILWIGAAYWRCVWDRLQGNRTSTPRALRTAARWQWTLLAIALLSAATSVTAFVVYGARPALIGALIFSTLAVLEYVNYFHVQLQNFDHGPTFRRFLKRRSFTRAHLAHELAAFRRNTRR